MEIDDKFAAVDRFRANLTNTFIDLCRGNDYNKLTLLKICDTIDRTYDRLIDDMRNDDEAGYSKNKGEAEWIDNHCSACRMTPIGEETWTRHGETPPRFELFMNFCPNCGAKMKGV